MTDAMELRRLTLQLQRDLVAQSSLRVLLAARDAIVSGHRQDLRALKARIKRHALRGGRTS